MVFTFEAGRMTDKSPKKVAVVFVENKVKFTEPAELLDTSLDGAISRGLKGSRYQGSMGEITHVFTDHAQVGLAIVVGTGRAAGLDSREWWLLGLKIGARLDALGVKEADICLGDIDSKAGLRQAGQMLIEGAAMALYRFDNFRSELKPHHEPKLEALTLLTTTANARATQDAWPHTAALLTATVTTRNAANLPPNVANPQYMAEQAKRLEKFGLKVEVLNENDMQKLGMNLILAVGSSAAPGDQPRIVLMHYNGGKKDDAPIALVGKGVMFDTGGYNLKPSNAMGGMKFDMSGAAAVLGAMEAIAQRKPKINVIGVMSCAMNMVGQTPFVPDSVYKSYKGLFVEIGNTDAEGRLVLADAIAYTIDKHNPSQVIDLATLTGACMVALGGAYGGLFSTSDRMARKLADTGEALGERLWRLPIDDCYKAKTTVADVNNDGSPYGGASTGATFIKNFVGNTPWAHLDIAGTTNAEKGSPGIPPELKGATGFGVRLLVNYVESEVGIAQIAPKQGKPGRPKTKGQAEGGKGRSVAVAKPKRGTFNPARAR